MTATKYEYRGNAGKSAEQVLMEKLVECRADLEAVVAENYLLKLKVNRLESAARKDRRHAAREEKQSA